MEERKTSKEIDVIAVVTSVLSEWKLLLKFIGIAAIIGLIVALNSIKEYTTSVVLAPEFKGKLLHVAEYVVFVQWVPVGRSPTDTPVAPHNVHLQGQFHCPE